MDVEHDVRSAATSGSARCRIDLTRIRRQFVGFIGSCQLNGHDVPGTAIGVLKNENGGAILPAVSAWKIDDKQMKFIELETEGLRCSRDGIITADGGS